MTPTPVPSYRERKWRCSSLSSARSTPYITSVLRFACVLALIWASVCYRHVDSPHFSPGQTTYYAMPGGDRGIRYIRGMDGQGKGTRRESSFMAGHIQDTIRTRTGDGAVAGWRRKGGTTWRDGRRTGISAGEDAGVCGEVAELELGDRNDANVGSAR